MGNHFPYSVELALWTPSICQSLDAFRNFRLNVLLASKNFSITEMAEAAVIPVKTPSWFRLEYAWFAFHLVVFR
jgi:hypothetical protein